MRRVTWVCGDQRILVEEVVDTTRRLLAPGPLDYVVLHAGQVAERDVWSATAQYPLTPGANRMILIRNAEKLTRWQPLTRWLAATRQLPGVYLVFVSNDTDLPYLRAEGKKAGLQPHVAAIRAPRGSLVKCSMPSDGDAVSWVQRHARIGDDGARHLLARAGGHLGEVKAVCAKVSLFDGEPTPAAIDALCRQRPVESFTDSLLALDKSAALLSVPSLTDKDFAMLIGLLDSRLDLLQALHHIHNSGQSVWETSGVNRYLARQYLPLARHYEPSRCVYRRRVLAVVDDVFRRGARDSVWEALVALW